MHIIPDTSIWIEFFKANEPIHSKMVDFLDNGEVLIVPIVFGELLQGALNKREIDLIDRYYQLLPKVEQGDLMIQAGIYSQKNKWINQGIGLIDAIIITSTIVSKSKLWTLDKKMSGHLDKTSYLY